MRKGIWKKKNAVFEAKHLIYELAPYWSMIEYGYNEIRCLPFEVDVQIGLDGGMGPRHGLSKLSLISSKFSSGINSLMGSSNSLRKFTDAGEDAQRLIVWRVHSGGEDTCVYTIWLLLETNESHALSTCHRWLWSSRRCCFEWWHTVCRSHQEDSILVFHKSGFCCCWLSLFSSKIHSFESLFDCVVILR